MTTRLFERFTERARQTVIIGQNEARALKHNYIGTEHILLGVVGEGTGIGARVLASKDIEAEDLRQWIRDHIGEGDETLEGQIPFTPRSKKVLELALREALGMGHNYIGTEHVLLGLIRENGGPHANYLADRSVSLDELRAGVIGMLQGQAPDPVADLNKAIADLKLATTQVVLAVERLKKAFPGP